MKKYLIVCFTILFSAQAISSDFVEGLGKFEANEKDSLSFVKKQLLYEAVKEIISKELDAMNLSKDLFWDVYNQRLEDYVAPTLDKIKEKYSDNPSKKEQKNMTQELRYQRLILRRKFGGLSRVINSYTIKKISRSVHQANMRYLQLHAKVKRPLLNKIYWQFVGAGEAGKYSKIFIKPIISLDNLTWRDLGVEIESDFTSVVLRHWMSRLEELYSPFCDQVILVDDVAQAKLDEYLYKETGRSSSFENSVLIELKVNLKGIREDAYLNYKNFKLSGDVIVYKLGMREVFSHVQISSKEYKFNTEDSQKLSSKLASSTYQFPLGKLDILKDNLSSSKRKETLMSIKIISPKNLLYVYTFMDYLKKEAVIFQPQITVSSYQDNNYEIVVKYFGNDEKFKSLLESLKNREFTKGSKLSINMEKSPYSVRFL